MRTLASEAGRFRGGEPWHQPLLADGATAATVLVLATLCRSFLRPRLPVLPRTLPSSLSDSSLLSVILGFSQFSCAFLMLLSPCSPEGSMRRNTTGFEKPPPSTSLWVQL